MTALKIGDVIQCQDDEKLHQLVNDLCKAEYSISIKFKSRRIEIIGLPDKVEEK